MYHLVLELQAFVGFCDGARYSLGRSHYKQRRNSDEYPRKATYTQQNSTIINPPYRNFNLLCFENKTDVHPDLLSCMNRIYLRGCEAEYLGSLGRISELCESRESSGSSLSSGPKTGNLACEVNTRQPPDPVKGNNEGSLVMHVRSGDIFDKTNHGISKSGQVGVNYVYSDWLLSEASLRYWGIT